MFRVARRGVPEIMLENASIGEFTLIVPPVAYHSIYLTGSTGASGGVRIETAVDPTYDGGWHLIGNLSIINNAVQFASLFGEGIKVIIALRARIINPIVGGGITLTYISGKLRRR
jgi:hypothetical protein